ncbi:MAG: extradiol ring-cleavage dioxygenase [Chloroflexi bacterium]|nr:MAG: extradiol ring-cleavage dioxygenase [Chloroflexota bacterium]
MARPTTPSILVSGSMAELVGGVGVPHDPGFPELVAREGPRSDVATRFGEIAAELEAMRPDALVVFTADHMNTFFLDNLPLFSVGVADRTTGPNDGTPALPRYDVPVAEGLAAHVRDRGIAAGFDLALTQEFAVDHSVLVPLHFLTPAMGIPIVPLFIAGIAPPLPTARRCFALGELVRDAVASWREPARVAVLASGSLCLDVGGSKAPGTKLSGCPDPAWAAQIARRLERGETRELLAEATDERIRASGNVSGELLNWIALLGAIGERKPSLATAVPAEGQAFVAWRAR